MSVLNLVREILDKVYHWHRVPASVKAKAVMKALYTCALRLKVDMFLYYNTFSTGGKIF
ncbi:hypothetical protein Hydth_1179 [Hydrogenobacter thermophilus TK-6]|uniref:Uncharacterized protein n=1 Tax=Hydrogenobacter thermophilus (strain DSM 6534 / IAM 12695 / TK-6) TaxID=608538 RepID=D3DII9_HYDTT|nr:hypothetical protein [Hydrogenobacter thermophilus]ADO45567.1 hypothetical protein Hydth_1179 [Hydrogenobacter thermophilus TK-6]BAI69641.1 hypothetical protein HTH_1187 [Hydrogenobacter thermophilus TK-6]